MKKLYFLIAGLVFVALALVASGSDFFAAPAQVKMAQVEVGPITTYLSATGTVVNREELTINSPIQGQVVKLDVAEGSAIRKGERLIMFDASESAIQVSKARAALDMAQQNEAEARRRHQRLKELFDVGGEAAKTVEEAELRLRTMQKETQNALADLRQARMQHDKFELIAPIDGTIIARTARVGTWVAPGTPLFRLAPDGAKEIEVRLDATDSLAATVGKAVVATSDAFPGKEWHEKITWVAPSTNKENAANTLGVRISLGQDAPSLVLGQQVDVKIPLVSRNRAFKIPSSAIMTRQGKPSVAVVVDGRVELRTIATGVEDLTHTEVTSGLTVGQNIILPEGKPLQEGDKVSVTPDRGMQ